MFLNVFRDRCCDRNPSLTPGSRPFNPWIATSPSISFCWWWWWQSMTNAAFISRTLSWVWVVENVRRWTQWRISFQLRRKIKSEIIGVKLLEETAHDFGSVLIDYSKVLFELIDSFLRDKNEIISNFSSTAFKWVSAGYCPSLLIRSLIEIIWYRLLFGIEGCDRKLLLAKLIGFVCMKRTPMPQTTEPSTVDVTTNALTILMEINKRHPIEMQNNGLQVLVSGSLEANRDRFTAISFSEFSIDRMSWV